MLDGNGDALNQLHLPYNLFVDDDQTIYVADYLNKRIVKWKSDATSDEVMAGGNGQGNRTDQLNYPSHVIFDKEADNLIICDHDNRRVMRWSRRSGTESGEIILANIACYELAMDNQRFFYVSDEAKNEVRRYRVGETEGTAVAGGNGQDDSSKQFNGPRYIFVDGDQSVYVSDFNNHRVMKWIKGAKEGIVVVGGQGQGNALTQLNFPRGVFIDQFDTVYVADTWNNRVMRWSKGMTQGDVIAGGNDRGAQANQLYHPWGLSFDRYGNLYVADRDNHRI